ncbi:hypothetical protein HHX47_DHR1001936 [Lentinula edodes]|nr:hypothetical protein HHX47_DHR1001936 [Lentinula edodes]
MFRRPPQAQCYFCNTFLPHPKDPRNFRCNSCGCWNRYDAKGEILSDEPQMHEESLNVKSFSKRASPSKDRLPTSYGSGPFCHNCQTNQHLIINLLSNYLPPPTSPEYEQRLEMVPRYRESLHTRYPPVCESCLPAVEEEIRKKDAMARAHALGGWLKETKGKVRQRRVSATLQERENISKELFAWRVRGCLWAATLGSFLAGYIATSFFVLRIQQPPTIRLINTKSHDLNNSRSPTPNPTDQSSRASTPAFLPKVSEPDLFASLTISSSQPVVPKSLPVFGLPSLLPSSAPTEADDEDKMDWTPTNVNPGTEKFKASLDSIGKDDGWWLRPQRFFAPEKPTGLESLFENTKLADDVPMKDVTAVPVNRSSVLRWKTHVEVWWWMYMAVLVLLMGVLLKLWVGRNGTSVQQDFQHISHDNFAQDPIQQSGVYRHTSRTSRI